MVAFITIVYVFLALFVWHELATIGLLAFTAYNVVKTIVTLVECRFRIWGIVSALLFSAIPAILGIIALIWAFTA